MAQPFQRLLLLVGDRDVHSLEVGILFPASDIVFGIGDHEGKRFYALRERNIRFDIGFITHSNFGR